MVQLAVIPWIVILRRAFFARAASGHSRLRFLGCELLEKFA